MEEDLESLDTVRVACAIGMAIQEPSKGVPIAFGK